MDTLEASLQNMAGQLWTASPCDIAAKKNADCKLECRAIQVFLSDAEADAPAVLTLYVVAKVFGQPRLASP